MAHIPKSHWIQSTCPWHSDTSRLEVWHAMLQRFYQWQIGVCTARCRRSKLKILVCFQKSDPEIHFRTFAHGKQLTGVSQTVGHTIPALLAAMLWKRGISMQTRYPSSRGKGSEGSPHEHGKINMIMINFQKKHMEKKKSFHAPIKFQLLLDLNKLEHLRQLRQNVLELPEPVHPTGLRETG